MHRDLAVEPDGLRCDPPAEACVMLHKQHGGLVFQQKRFDLHPGKHIDIIERLVPYIKMGRRCQAGCQKDLLFLPLGLILYVFKELGAFKVQLAQDRQKQAFVQAPFPTKVPDGPLKA